MLRSSNKTYFTGWSMGGGSPSKWVGAELWVFQPNMLFNARNKWWGDLGMRDFPHEGTDFCLYKDTSRRVFQVNEKTEIPVVFDGRIRAMFKDYLGEAIIVEHPVAEADQPVFLSIYAHTMPRNDLTVGDKVIKNEVIATIADVKNSKAKILPHLHLSLGWPTQAMVYDQFEWNRLRDPNFIRLIDPLEFLDLSYEVLVNDDNAVHRQKGLAKTI